MGGSARASAMRACTGANAQAIVSDLRTYEPLMFSVFSTGVGLGRYILATGHFTDGRDTGIPAGKRGARPRR